MTRRCWLKHLPAVVPLGWTVTAIAHQPAADRRIFHPERDSGFVPLSIIPGTTARLQAHIWGETIDLGDGTLSQRLSVLLDTCQRHNLRPHSFTAGRYGAWWTNQIDAFAGFDIYVDLAGRMSPTGDSGFICHSIV